MGYYIPELYDFLRDVEANNNRPWFQAHKEQYDYLRRQWMADLDRLVAAMAAWEPGMKSQSAQSAAYRFYRDTRFSLDKSPYKTYFSALLSPHGRKTTYGAWYLQMDCRVEENGLYGGVWMPETAALKKLRHAIVDNIDEWNEITHDPALLECFPGWFEQGALKTVPKGWPKDHPQAEILRLRQYGKYCIVPEEFFHSPDWPERAAERFRLLKPLIDFLNYSLDEDTTF